jgi:phasin family protein
MTEKTSPKIGSASVLGQQNEAFTAAVSKSMSAFSEISGKSKQGMEAVTASGSVAAKTAGALNKRAVAYSKKAAEDAMAAAKAIAAAKSPQQAIELQTNFAQAAFSTYVAEFSAISGLLVDSFSETFAPFQGMGSVSKKDQ